MNGYERAIQDSAIAMSETAAWVARAQRAEAEVRRLRERRLSHSLIRQDAERDAASLRRAASKVLRILGQLNAEAFAEFPEVQELQAAIDAHKQ